MFGLTDWAQSASEEDRHVIEDRPVHSDARGNNRACCRAFDHQGTHLRPPFAIASILRDYQRYPCSSADHGPSRREMPSQRGDWLGVFSERIGGDGSPEKPIRL